MTSYSTGSSYEPPQPIRFGHVLPGHPSSTAKKRFVSNVDTTPLTKQQPSTSLQSGGWQQTGSGTWQQTGGAFQKEICEPVTSGTPQFAVGGATIGASGAMHLGGCIPVEGSFPIRGSVPVEGKLPLEGLIPFTRDVPVRATFVVEGMLRVSGEIPLRSSLAVSGCVPLSGTLPFSTTIPLVGDVPLQVETRTLPSQPVVQRVAQQTETISLQPSQQAATYTLPSQPIETYTVPSQPVETYIIPQQQLSAAGPRVTGTGAVRAGESLLRDERQASAAMEKQSLPSEIAPSSSSART